MCPCAAIYKVDSIKAIKQGLILSDGNVAKDFVHARGHVSTIPRQYASMESEALINKRLKIAVASLSEMPTDSHLVSNSSLSNRQETAFENFTLEMSREMCQHKDYVRDFRMEALPQMTGGRGPLIQMANGVVENIRALHNSNLWNHRVNNNCLNRNVISNINGSVTVPDNHVVIIDNDHNSGCLAPRSMTNDVTEVIDLDSNDSLDGLISKKASTDRENDVDGGGDQENSFDFDPHALISDAETLYSTAQDYYWFLEENSKLKKDYYRHLYAHLADECSICKQLCATAILMKKKSSAVDAIRMFDKYMDQHHY